MGSFNPSVTPGRVVLYTLTADDARLIDAQRYPNRPIETPRHEFAPGVKGNTANVGDTFPAVVVRSWAQTCNLKVLLDGNDDYWAPSRKQGDGQGEWQWPPRV